MVPEKKPNEEMAKKLAKFNIPIPTHDVKQNFYTELYSKLQSETFRRIYSQESFSKISNILSKIHKRELRLSELYDFLVSEYKKNLDSGMPPLHNFNNLLLNEVLLPAFMHELRELGIDDKLLEVIKQSVFEGTSSIDELTYTLQKTLGSRSDGSVSVDRILFVIDMAHTIRKMVVFSLMESIYPKLSMTEVKSLRSILNSMLAADTSADLDTKLSEFNSIFQKYGLTLTGTNDAEMVADYIRLFE